MHKVSEQLLKDIVKCLEVLKDSHIQSFEKLHKAEKKAEKLIKQINENYLQR